jgi:DNA repair and recombination protein RAD54B
MQAPLIPLLQYMKKKKAELASLGRWRHISCLRPFAGENVRDQVLRKLLHVPAPAPLSAAAAAKKPGRSAVLDALDEGGDFEDEPAELSLQDIPGGTISFLFEKGDDDPAEEESEDTGSSAGDAHMSGIED